MYGVVPPAGAEVNVIVLPEHNVVGAAVAVIVGTEPTVTVIVVGEPLHVPKLGVTIY